MNNFDKIMIIIIVLLTIVFVISANLYRDYSNLKERCAESNDCLEECGCHIISSCNLEVSTDQIGEAINNFTKNGVCGNG